MEVAYRRKSGEVRQGLIATEAMTLAGTAEPLKISMVVDMTERKQLESQLLHAQRMDVVGRLAGGVASSRSSRPPTVRPVSPANCWPSAGSRS